MIEQLRLITIMVYLKSKSGVPRIVSKALSREGKYIPKVVVFDDEIKDEIGLVYYEMAKQDGTKAFGSLKKEIQKYTRRKRKQLREKYY